uniref:Putative secreted protein n=1 Tax=Anopheles marajoara TaxID=58244 RepID=A0A2M4CBC5_9DIPT
MVLTLIMISWAAPSGLHEASLFFALFWPQLDSTRVPQRGTGAVRKHSPSMPIFFLLFATLPRHYCASMRAWGVANISNITL